MEPVGVLLAVREGQSRAFDPGGLPELHLRGLDAQAANAQLAQRTGEALPPQLCDRLVDLARGNPLALLELPLALSEAQRTGAEPVGEDVPLTPVIEDAFLARVRMLPAGSQTLLLIAAADDTADPRTVLDAARRMGIGAAAAEAAEAAGLLRIAPDAVLFRHPLVRSAVYATASFAQRAAVHRSLAETPDADQRAWHQAAALAGPDDGVADALERSAERARARGGHGAAAAALEQASLITADPRRRARRLSAAAEAAWLAGRTLASLRLIGQARRLPADPQVTADIEYDRARGAHQLRELVHRHRLGTQPGAARPLPRAARGRRPRRLRSGRALRAGHHAARRWRQALRPCPHRTAVRRMAAAAARTAEGPRPPAGRPGPVRTGRRAAVGAAGTGRVCGPAARLRAHRRRCRPAS